MFVVHVYIHIKPEFIEEFIQATINNARNSLQEPGIARFDFIQQVDDPTRFMLIEVYRHDDAPAQHKETPHYAKWRDTVSQMMAEDRYYIKFSNIYPEDEDW